MFSSLKLSIILKSNVAIYLWNIRFDLLSESSKTKSSSLLLFKLTFQVIYLTIFKSQGGNALSKSFLLLVTSTDILLITASFLAQNQVIDYFNSLSYCSCNRYLYYIYLA